MGAFQMTTGTAAARQAPDSTMTLVSSGMLGEGPQNTLNPGSLVTGGLLPNGVTDPINGLGLNAPSGVPSGTVSGAGASADLTGAPLPKPPGDIILLGSGAGLLPPLTTGPPPSLLQQAADGTLQYTPNPLSAATTRTAQDGSNYTVPPQISVVSPYANARPAQGMSGPITEGGASRYGHDDEKIYTYSGTDMRVMLDMSDAIVPVGAPRKVTPKPKQLIEIHTLSISIYRVKTAVRACGYINPKAFSRGTRTIGGTMILTPFTVDILYRFLLGGAASQDSSEDSHFTKPDQLPPFNLTLMFADEFGNISHRRLLGIEMSTDGTVYSQNDMYSEQTILYQAADFTPLQANTQPVRQLMLPAAPSPMSKISSDSALVADVGQYGKLPALLPPPDGQSNALPGMPATAPPADVGQYGLQNSAASIPPGLLQFP
jgi:hypothetical protein